MSVFLDSYAIIEMARDNPHYDPIEAETVVTSVWDLLEAYYILAQDMLYESVGYLTPG